MNVNQTSPVVLSSFIGDKTNSITKDECSYYGRLNTTGFGLIRSYEGIPENLIVNLIVSFVREIDEAIFLSNSFVFVQILFLVFVYLRRRFSDSKNIVEGTEYAAIFRRIFSI